MEEFMKRRGFLIALSVFHSVVNTLYLVRFFGIWPPEELVYGYVPWFMSFALPNAAFTAVSWLLVYALIKNRVPLAVTAGFIKSGGLIFHALIGLMFGLYTGLFIVISVGVLFEISVYIYGLLLAAFYISQFGAIIYKNLGK